MQRTATIIAAALAATLGLAAHADTTFTYQGRLTDGGTPVNGPVDLSFTIFDAEVDGNSVGPILDASGVPVSGGLFTADLDFGVMAFDGSPRWLEVVVDGVTLTPRQPFHAYSMHTRGIHVDDANRVGLGTEAPNTRLHVVGEDNDGDLATLTVQSGGQRMLFDGNEIDTNTPLFLNLNSGQDVKVETGTLFVGQTSATSARLRVAGPDNDGNGLAAIIIDSPGHRLLLDGNGIESTTGAIYLNLIPGQDVIVGNTLEVGDTVEVGNAVRFADGSRLTGGIYSRTAALGQFPVSRNGSTAVTLEVGGARHGDAVIVTPLDYPLWPDHVIGYARVSGPDEVRFRIDSYSSDDRTYSAADWRVTVIR